MKLLKSIEFKVFFISLVSATLFGFLQIFLWAFVIPIESTFIGELVRFSIWSLPVEVTVVTWLATRTEKVGILKRTLLILLGGLIPGFPAIQTGILPVIYFFEILFTIAFLELLFTQKKISFKW